MATVKSGPAAAEKWARRTPLTTEDYQLGVRNPRVNWSDASKAAEDRYKAGTTEAMNAGRYGKGIARAGEDQWQKKTLAKGPQRFAEGVALSAPDYQAAVQPFLDVISKTAMPPRFATGDPRNLERVKAIAQALRKAKTG